MDHMETDDFAEEDVESEPEMVIQEVEHADVDLETYISSYSGFAKFIRLIFVAKRCKSLRIEALMLALAYLQQETYNYTEYVRIYQMLASIARNGLNEANHDLASHSPGLHYREDNTNQRLHLKPSVETITIGDKQINFDSNWIEQTRRSSATWLERLDTDLKNYKANNMLESIRRGSDDLANLQLKMGDVLGASKNYLRSRDYCRSDTQELNVCFNVIKVTIYLSQCSHSSTFLARAESLLDNIKNHDAEQRKNKDRMNELYQSAQSAIPIPDGNNLPFSHMQSRFMADLDATPSFDSASAVPRTPTRTPSDDNPNVMPRVIDVVPVESGGTSDNISVQEQSWTAEQREWKIKVETRLNCIGGLLAMGRRQYKRAAELFLKTHATYNNMPELLTQSDVAHYGVLCALATFDRAELRTQSPWFKQLLENEPDIRDLVTNFYQFRFTECMSCMDRIKNRLLLDIYMADHVTLLYRYIRKRALCQYFSPYMIAELSSMTQSFNTTVPELQKELTELILSGEMSARIDSHSGLLYSRRDDPREKIYKDTFSLMDKYEKQVKALALKFAISKHNLFLPGPAEYKANYQ